MSEKPYYAWEKFGDAVRHLAIGEGDAKSRLYDAFLCIGPLSERDIPGELLEDYRNARGLLTSKDPKEGEGRLVATLRGMRMRRASEIAESIFNIYLRLSEICAREE